MFRRILVPTDGSELSTEALKSAVGLAKENGASLVLLNVQPVYRPPIVAEVPIGDVFSQEEYEASAREAANRILVDASAIASGASVPVTTLTEFDPSPWEAIIRVAREEGCDLIFMASHGRRGLAALVLGSETQKVLTHTKIPVIVYR